MRRLYWAWLVLWRGPECMLDGMSVRQREILQHEEALCKLQRLGQEAERE